MYTQNLQKWNIATKIVFVLITTLTNSNSTQVAHVKSNSYLGEGLTLALTWCSQRMSSRRPRVTFSMLFPIVLS